MQKRKENIRYTIIVSLAALLIFGFSLLHIILPDNARSKGERRALAKTPSLSAETVFSGRYMTELEEYLLDQFPLRDGYRAIKALTNKYAFNRADTNGLYTVGDSIYKLDNALDISQIKAGTDKSNDIIDKYLANAFEVYVSVIPDKTWYLDSAYKQLDYGGVAEIVAKNIPRAKFIDISTVLNVGDYYRTDTHWRHEKLQGVLNILANEMKLPSAALNLSDYTAHELYPFDGVYLGQSALPIKPDTLTYLTHPSIDAASVWSVEKPNTTLPLYTLNKFAESVDGYDVFLDGAAALLTITNENAATNRSLVLFRDSFGSSLAPLLCSVYKEITLIDLRYISSELLGDYVDFANADVLFLYSASMWNSAKIMK